MGMMHRQLEEESMPGPELPQKKEKSTTLKALKCGLIFLNLLTSMITGFVVGIVIYLFLTEYTPRDVTEILENNIYEVISFVAIVSAGVFLLMSICGYIGAIMENKFCLAVYILVTLMVLSSLLVTGIFGFVFRQSILDRVQTNFEYTISYKYGVNKDQDENNLITTIVDYMQENYKCCGAAGNENSSTSWALYKTSSKWYKQFSSGLPYVPDSCCDPGGDYTECTGFRSLNGPPSQGPPYINSMTENSQLYVTGCFDKLQTFLEEKSLQMSALALGAVASMILTLICAIALARRIQKK